MDRIKVFPRLNLGIEMIKRRMGALILMFAILTSSSCYAKDDFDGQDIFAAEGKISAIDTFKSTVTVKSLMLYPVIKYKEVNLFISPSTKIMNKSGPISIFDLIMGNPVEVKYAGKDDILEALLIKVTK